MNLKKKNVDVTGFLVILLVGLNYWYSAIIMSENEQSVGWLPLGLAIIMICMLYCLVRVSQHFKIQKSYHYNEKWGKFVIRYRNADCILLVLSYIFSRIRNLPLVVIAGLMVLISMALSIIGLMWYLRTLNDIDESTVNQFMLKQNVVLEMIDQEDESFKDELFTSKVIRKINLKAVKKTFNDSPELLISVTLNRRKKWLSFLKRQDTVVISQLEDIVKGNLRIGFSFSGVFSVVFGAVSAIFALLGSFYFLMSPVLLSAIKIEIAVVFAVAIIMFNIFYATSHDDDNTNLYLLSIIDEVKAMQ